MYCKHCGKEIADDSKFCQHCGGEQDALSDSTQSVESVTDKESSKGKVIEIPTIKTNSTDTNPKDPSIKNRPKRAPGKPSMLWISARCAHWAACPGKASTDWSAAPVNKKLI